MKMVAAVVLLIAGSLAAQPIGKLVDIGNGRRLHIVCMGSGIPTVVMESGAAEGFTKDYDVNRLVYFECFDEVETAIQREKRLKKWPRAWKIAFIDLYPEIAQG